MNIRENKKGLKRQLFIFKKGQRIRAELVAVKKEAKFRNRASRRKRILSEK